MSDSTMSDPVESVISVRRNGPLIAKAARLWIRHTDTVLDATYGRGLFWTEFRPATLIAHDWIVDGVDFRQLPEPDGSVNVVVFDPPYIPQGGRETSGLPDFLNRYGLVDVPKTHGALAAMVAAGMAEGFRVLAPGGRMFVKCMDYVHGGRYRTGRHNVVSTALELGLEQVDEFIHHSGRGAQPKTNIDGSPRRQVHSRRAHSFLCVFQKPPIWLKNGV